MVLIDWRQVSYPYLDEAMPLLDAVLQRAKTEGVRSVICDGEVIYADGKFTKVDRDGALRALHDDLQQGAGGRRGGTPAPVEGAAAACAGVLRQLFRSGPA